MNIKPLSVRSGKINETTANVNFKTTRAVHPTAKSHINQVVLDTESWEASAAFRLELSPCVRCYARNDELGLTIPYEYLGIDHNYRPDFLVELTNGLHSLLELKGWERDEDRCASQCRRTLGVRRQPLGRDGPLGFSRLP